MRALVLQLAAMLASAEPWFAANSNWCSESPPPRPSLPQTIAQFDDGWVSFIEDKVACQDPGLEAYGIQCQDVDGIREYTFSSGIYSLSS